MRWLPIIFLALWINILFIYIKNISLIETSIKINLIPEELNKSNLNWDMCGTFWLESKQTFITDCWNTDQIWDDNYDKG